MTTTTIPRHVPAPWAALIIGVVLVAALAFTATTVLDRPEAAPVTTDVSAVTDAELDHAARLHDAARELIALRRTVHDVPSIADAMDDRRQQLKLAVRGQIPVESLESSQ